MTAEARAPGDISEFAGPAPSHCPVCGSANIRKYADASWHCEFCRENQAARETRDAEAREAALLPLLDADVRALKDLIATLDAQRSRGAEAALVEALTEFVSTPDPYEGSSRDMVLMRSGYRAALKRVNALLAASRGPERP